MGVHSKEQGLAIIALTKRRRKMNRLIVLSSILVMLVGCAWLQQAGKDYNTGKITPLVNGEVSPSDKAAAVSAPIAALPIPYAAPIAGVVGFLGTIFFTWQRGQAIRKTGVPAVQATSGPNMFVGIEQFLANVFAGSFTVVSNNPSITGTIFQRAWKGALVTVGVGLTAALADPTIGTFLTAHPWVATGIVAANSAVLALEKAFSLVPTVTPAPTTGSTATTTVITA